MRALILGLAALAIGCSSSPPPVAATEPEPADAPIEIDFEVIDDAQVYRGDEGLRVTVVPLVSDDPEEFLIEVRGLRSDIDGLVLRYEKAQQGRDRFSYVTTINGRDYNTVWIDRRRGTTRVEVYLPGISGSRAVSFDEDASAEVDPQKLARRHAEIVADGTVAELQAFNRDERQAHHDESLGDEMARRFATCEMQDVPVQIDWSTVTDEQLKQYSVSSFCGAVGRGAESVCRFAQGREAVKERVREVRCEIGDEMALRLDDGVLTWTADFEGTNAHMAAASLLSAELGRDRVVLRTDGGIHLLLDPGDAEFPVYVSEDGETFYEHVEMSPSSSGHSRWLFAPGEGSRLRHRDDAWTLSCGDTEHALSELPRDQNQSIVDAAELEGRIWRREPFALARDDRGRYYYVDRLAEEFGGKGFRVFSGMRGNATLTRLVDIVDDSEGTIFSTEDGDLRLIIQRQAVGEAYWVRNDDRTSLTVLAIPQNQELIYRGLGVYDGERLGSVCELL